jgi:hypothetical protein
VQGVQSPSLWGLHPHTHTPPGSPGFSQLLATSPGGRVRRKLRICWARPLKPLQGQTLICTSELMQLGRRLSPEYVNRLK